MDASTATGKTERICLTCRQPKDILVSLCNECKSNMTEEQLNEFYNGPPWQGCAECGRRQVLMDQAANHIEKQQSLLDQQERMIKELHSRLEKVEQERTQFCDLYTAQKKKNEQLLGLNCQLEARIEILGG